MIDFKSFTKEELIVAAEFALDAVNNYENSLKNLVEVNTEEYLRKKLNVMKFNRLNGFRNQIAQKINDLIKKRPSKQRDEEVSKLYANIEKVDKQREKQLKILLNIKAITQKEYDELSA